MRRGCFTPLVLCAALAALSAAPAFAAIGFTGTAGTAYSPPGTWTSSTAGYIGYQADCTMPVNAGSA